MSTFDRSDLEDRMSEWLRSQGVDDDIAPQLVDCGVRIEQLEAVAGCVSGEALSCAVRWISAAATAHAMAADVHRATRRIHDVVSAMQQYSHMDRAAVREPTDVGAGLANTVDVIRCGPKASRVKINLDVEPSLPPVAAVAPDLNQMWTHLIENAIDAAPDGGAVEVRAARAGASVVVSVTDGGAGIAENIQHRIFEPFFTTKDVGDGVGLGLYTVRRVASEFGGEVELKSRPGKTEFSVRLPGLL
jgi:signal transduction histidine kinase